jgi:hypothetical protein
VSVMKAKRVSVLHGPGIVRGCPGKPWPMEWGRSYDDRPHRDLAGSRCDVEVCASEARAVADPPLVTTFDLVSR